MFTDDVRYSMKYVVDKNKGLTVLEMVISLAIMAIIFAVILPQFTSARNSWFSQKAASEVIQNGRVLMDSISHNLSEAVRIIDVSDSSISLGYIEFEDNNGVSYRFDVGPNDYVRFGPVGNPADLAGPVSQLQFTCYSLEDFDTPTTNLNSIRFVKVNATFTNSAVSSRDKTFIISVCLRTNGILGVGTVNTYDYSNRTPGTNIFAYDGEDNQQVPASSTEPSEVLSSGEYDDIEINDSSFHIFSAPSNSKYAQMRFVLRIEEDKKNVEQIIATWNGKGVNGDSGYDDGASFYIWNYNSSGYEFLDESADTEVEVTLIGTLTSFPANYIGGAGDDTIILLAVSKSKKPNKEALELSTDYVKLEIAESGGGILP